MIMDNIMSQLENDLNNMQEETKYKDDETETEKEIGDDYSEIESVYFAFIDVLGFSKKFGAGVKNKEKKNKLANDYKDIFNYFFLLINSSKLLENDQNTCAGQTSDSLYFYTDRVDRMIEFLKIYSHFSLYAMSKNIFFRGGIAKGCLFKNQPYQFFGDSIIKAYSLESEISRNPIITVDSSASKDLNEEKIFNKMKKEDKDNNRIYIDPFYGWGRNNLDVHLEDGIKPRDINYDKIEEIIKENLNDFEYDDKNYHKYLFLEKALPNK